MTHNKRTLLAMIQKRRRVFVLLWCWCCLVVHGQQQQQQQRQQQQAEGDDGSFGDVARNVSLGVAFAGGAGGGGLDGGSTSGSGGGGGTAAARAGDDKYRPDKGNPLCDNNDVFLSQIANASENSGNYHNGSSSSSSSQPPCRSDQMNDDKVVAAIGQNDSSTGTAGTPVPGGGGTATAQPPRNRVSVTMYMALAPYRRSLGFMVDAAITVYLNTRYPQVNVRFRRVQHYYDIQGMVVKGIQSGALTGDWTTALGGDDKGLLDEINAQVVSTSSSGTNESDVNIWPDLDRWFPKGIIEMDVFHLATYPRIVGKAPGAWWWQYDVVYECYYPQTHIPFINTSILHGLSAHFNSSTQELVAWGQSHRDLLTKVIGTNFVLSWDFPNVLATEDLRPQPSPSHGDHPHDYITPVDTHLWDWRRYAGLGLLLGTVLGTAALMKISAWRRHRKLQNEFWGNLSTEQGVNEILRTGWTIRGSKMKIFYKNDKDCGHRDDDSLFIGGYEQREGCSGEVTAGTTPPASSVTPEQMAPIS